MTTEATVFRYFADPDWDLIRELVASVTWWVYRDGVCIGTAEPNGDGTMKLRLLPLLWEGDQA